MTDCRLVVSGQCADGRILLTCVRCHQPPVCWRDATLRRRCGDVSRLAQLGLPEPAERAVEEKAKERGLLLGDFVAQITASLGIPPCGGCQERQEWLNRLHVWLLGR